MKQTLISNFYPLHLMIKPMVADTLAPTKPVKFAGLAIHCRNHMQLRPRRCHSAGRGGGSAVVAG